MKSLDKALLILTDIESESNHAVSFLSRIDARAKLIVTLIYLIVLLSFPLDNLAGIILFAIYPLVGASLADIPYSRILKASLIVLPFIAFIGIFNPLYDRTPMFSVGDITISKGWIEFVSILIRGLLSVQATVLLIISTGFIKLCRALRKLGVPKIFTTQLFLLYRYIFVLILEAIDMHRARESRGYGKKSYGIKFWSLFVGQLLLRTTARAERIHKAMLSRGFQGELTVDQQGAKWTVKDTLYCLAWISLFIFARVYDIPSLFSHFN